MFNFRINNFSDATQSLDKIPKIIHQTYKNHDLPEIYQRCQTEIKRFHPDFEYRFYTDDDMDRLMKTEFPEYYDKFNELPRMIMKIDMFRYFLMYKYGGLYTDMDYFIFKPFDLLGYNVVIPCNKEDRYGTPICLGNCIFASQPGHTFWKVLMDTLFTIDRTKKEYSYDKNIDENILGTGPMFVFNKWKEYSQNNKDIYIPRKQLFHPISKKNDDHIDQLKMSGCYGMHVCTGLWRNKKL
jgi:mannosyltransferase OCH1-like enzyme